jgi:hypothetical protein
MNAKLASMLGLSVLLAAGIVSTALTINHAQAQPYEDRQKGKPGDAADRMSAAMSKGRGASASGTISSVQAGANNTAWVVSGTWKMVIPRASVNASSPDVSFRASFVMVMTDGTSKHKHTISNFQLLNSTSDSTSMTLRGTATISLKDGPMEDVPVTIKIMNRNVIQIIIDPAVVNHFGMTPIYGVVTRARM